MRAVVIVAAVLFISACAHSNQQGQTSLAEMAASNQSKLMQLSVGMTKSDVLSVMGSETATTRDGIVNNPWTVETAMGNDGVQCEALYYLTRKNQPFTPVRKSLTTPVVIKNGQVVGWGEAALQRCK
ncbi:DUF3192 domain-containing protein [Defluviicoccus vanus]|uniref:DUF3192 domain-containing protein n=1 Tax=Defluviicoccus vanus TaxID=111831 RepID=A0A7H1N0K4_9PROT|nr:DUF3192 domain-containing protein [Defluviicoccus vanus]QNT69240.1 DUF3192 domain-containing protein [Defluviicoccus vanus]